MTKRTFDTRAQSGTTLLELLVAIVITGIAIAGITEMLWINTAWSTRILNKTDNTNQLKVFFERFEADVRAASNIGDAKNQTMKFQRGPYSFFQDATTLILQKPLFDTDGLPILHTDLDPSLKSPDVDTIIYQLVEDGRDSSRSTFQLIKYVFRGQSDSTAGDVNGQVVLQDIIGPIDKATQKVCWFSLVDVSGNPVKAASFPLNGDGFPLAQNISSVVADVQVNKTGASNAAINKDALDRSIIVAKSETFMRNRWLQ